MAYRIRLAVVGAGRYARVGLVPALRALAHFPHCVRTRQSPLASGGDALSTDDLVDRIYPACGLPLLT